MAIKIDPNKVYHAQSPAIGSGLIQVIGGSVKIVGSNVTEYEEDTKKLIVPEFSSLIETGDELSEGFHPLAGLPEWFGIKGSATAVWVKMCVDPRIEPGE
jgi:hypothetical protein